MGTALTTTEFDFSASLAAGGVVPTHKATAIVRKDVDKQIVYGVVYAPGEVDAHGDIMSSEAIEMMAHKFMQLMVAKGAAVIDQQHDNVPLAAYPVESYIETVEGLDWPVGSWVLGVKIEDNEIWSRIKKGELNGYSFEAMVSKMPAVVDIEMDLDMLSVTGDAEGHNHLYFLELNEQGLIIGGITSMDKGHRHVIERGTATEKAGAPGVPPHAHRLPVS